MKLPKLQFKDRVKTLQLPGRLNKSKGLIFITIFAVAGSILLFATRAATPFASLEPEQGTKTAQAIVGSDTTASGGQFVQFGSLASPPPAGFPDATNTGYQNGGADGKTAGPYTGPLTRIDTWTHFTTPNMTYTHCIIGPGPSFIEASNITFNGCKFYGDFNTLGTTQTLIRLNSGTNFTCNYCTFEGTAPPSGGFVADPNGYGVAVNARGGVGPTIRHSNFEGGTPLNWGPTSATLANPITFADNYAHDQADPSMGNHTSLIGDTETVVADDGWITINHNTLDCFICNTQNIALQGNPGTYTNVQITNNLLIGGGYTLAEMRDWHKFTVTGNVFSTKYFDNVGRFGPIYPGGPWPTGDGSLWQNNKWLVPSGSPGNPADNGKFIWPNGSLNTADYVQW